MNLLNGLAVSDVGELLAEAEIISIKSRVKTVTYMHKRKSQNQTDRKELDEELEYLEGGQASQSKMEVISTWWLKSKKRKEGESEDETKRKEEREDLPDSIKYAARTVALGKQRKSVEETQLELKENVDEVKKQIGEVKDILASLKEA